MQKMGKSVGNRLEKHQHLCVGAAEIEITALPMEASSMVLNPSLRLSPTKANSDEHCLE
jgi:hypothetical protein